MTELKNSATSLILLSWLIIILAFSACIAPAQPLSPFDSLPDQPSRKPELPDEPVSGPSYRIIPDSELVFGPSLDGFSAEHVLPESAPLLAWFEEIPGSSDDQSLNGAHILEKVSREYSVNPRLLLVLLDYFTEAVSGSEATISLAAPFMPAEGSFSGLFRQLSWAANQLNRGYYVHRVGALQRITLRDGVQVDISADANTATATLQYLLGLLLDYPDWQLAVGPLGVYARYIFLFGDPHQFAIEPLIPADLIQPFMRLPFDPQEGWYFTGGPHSAWGSGAAWGALDFAPDEDQVGCYDSYNQVLAVADGWVVRSQEGAVVQNLDGYQNEGSGWTVLYMHIAERERVQEGVYLQAGDPLGYSSCEGGPSTGTHLHLARRFNGEWIPADQGLPFVLDGWISVGDGVEYNGWLAKEGQTIKALGYPSDENKVFR